MNTYQIDHTCTYKIDRMVPLHQEQDRLTRLTSSMVSFGLISTSIELKMTMTFSCMAETSSRCIAIALVIGVAVAVAVGTGSGV